MDTWQLQEAKNKFSEVVKRALSGRPQRVTRHGEEVAFVISAAEVRRKHQEMNPEMSLADFLLTIPRLLDDDDDLFVRMNGSERNIDLDP
jgi:antitoxin Phd